MDFAIGWFDLLSAIAAYLIISSLLYLPIGLTSVTVNTPFVNVPVLSHAMADTFDNASI